MDLDGFEVWCARKSPGHRKHLVLFKNRGGLAAKSRSKNTCTSWHAKRICDRSFYHAMRTAVRGRLAAGALAGTEDMPHPTSGRIAYAELRWLKDYIAHRK